MQPFDASKFRKQLTKSISGISTGFNDPKTWVSTGNYALNYMISGKFNNGIPLGKVTIVAGESGSGKSYICSGNIIKDAQDKGIFVVLIDSENALDEKWLQALDVDTSPEKLMRFDATFIDDVGKIFNDFCAMYESQYPRPEEGEEDNRPKVLFVIDSLGMLTTDIADSQFKDGNMKGDLGHTPKKLKALIKGCIPRCAKHEIGLVCTNHTYASQDMFSPDPKISGGSGPIFAASQVLSLTKLKLKEDDKGNKISNVTGIRSKAQVVKSRFSKPFESVEVKIPYETRMDPYSGLFELFTKHGIVTKPSGNKWVYVDGDGIEHKEFEKAFSRNYELLDKIMYEIENNIKELVVEDDEDEEIIDE